MCANRFVASRDADERLPALDPRSLGRLIVLEDLGERAYESRSIFQATEQYRR